jgi:hypothetical protein
MSDKTKAALQGGQYENVLIKPIQNTTLIDLVNRNGNSRSGVCRDLDIPPYGGGTAPLARFDIVGCAPLADTPSPEFSGDQLFISMPRCLSSFLIMRFIQAEIDASPSCSRAAFIPSSNEGSTRRAICLLPLPLICSVDTWLTPAYSEFVNQVYDKCHAKTTPRSACNTYRASDRQPLFEVTVMADYQHTQSHPKYQYRFLALARADLSAKPCRLSVEAATEREARRILAPQFILAFAARLPIQGVRHG